MNSIRLNRRIFLARSLFGVSALGIGASLGGNLFAFDGTEHPLIAKVPDSHPLKEALSHAQSALDALSEIHNYTATFIKREQVGRKTLDAQMNLKVRENPFSVYLKFVQPNAGREALYVHGANNNQVKVRDVGFAGLAGAVNLDPLGSFAMDGNRYPVTNIGLRTLVTKLVENWVQDSQVSRASQVQVSQVSLNDGSKAKLVETYHAAPQAGVKMQRIRFYVSESTGIPFRVQAYDFAPRGAREGAIVEDYQYTNLAVNVGLSNADFSDRNPSYRFS